MASREARFVSARRAFSDGADLLQGTVKYDKSDPDLQKRGRGRSREQPRQFKPSKPIKHRASPVINVEGREKERGRKNLMSMEKNIQTEQAISKGVTFPLLLRFCNVICIRTMLHG